MRNRMRDKFDVLSEDVKEAVLHEDSQTRAFKEEKAVDKWSNKRKYPVIADGWENLSEQEQKTTAVLLENQDKHLKAIQKFSETAISSAYSLTPEKVL